MQACLLVRSAVVAGFVCAGAALFGCRAEANIKASTNDNEPRDEPVTAAAPAAAAPVAAAPTPSRSESCPLFCYEARGSMRAEVTAEENAQLKTALEPTLARLQQCTSVEDWRRHGSPTINVRLAPDGTFADMGVDPHHGHESYCFDQVGRGASASVTLPGRKVVRCAEHCARAPRAQGGRGRGRRGGR